MTIDPILLRLSDPTVEPGFKDPRHCLVFWARPPQKVKSLIAAVQQRIQTAASRLWLMPPDNLHMTALEITHSLTDPEIRALVSQLEPRLPDITDYTYTHRARLIKPLVTYDAQALALSFLPAAGEALPADRSAEDDAFSYHHLRRDLYALAGSSGVKVASRYVVPSAHLTIGRFIYASEFEDAEGKVDSGKVAELVRVIEETNAWLQADYWPREGSDSIRSGGEWIVGEEKGLDCKQGTLWYGGGERVRLGKGF